MHATKSLCMAATSRWRTSSDLCVTSGTPNTNSSSETPSGDHRTGGCLTLPVRENLLFRVRAGQGRPTGSIAPAKRRITKLLKDP